MSGCKVVQNGREIDRYYAGYVSRLRDVVELAGFADGEDVPAELLERLGIDAPAYVSDAAWEAAESSVYAVERLAVVENDGTVGELRQVELLLGGGGPTITLTVRLRGGDEVSGFTLWHSWGSSVGEQASLEAPCQADIETVDAFLRILGVVA